MVGNVWLPQAFESLVEIISLARQERRDFPDIIWYCHRSSLDRLNLCPTSLPDGFVYGGFRDEVSSESELADLCIVPINGKNSGHSGYSRFSLPSRVSELYFSGVPVVAIADKETAFSRYIERTGTGVTLSPKNTVESKNILLALLDSPDDRSAYGKAGTEFARNHFEATAFRKRLRERLAMISNYKFPLELGRK
jgi:glycosyltransferase involved in cell wall biosynthesis